MLKRIPRTAGNAGNPVHREKSVAVVSVRTCIRTGRIVEAATIVALCSAGRKAATTVAVQNASTDFSVLSGPAVSGGERLGSSLAWGDFDGNGAGDLAMGAPGFNVFFGCGRNLLFTGAGEVCVQGRCVEDMPIM